MVTIEDIARKAGVSYSTVSRALSDSPLVNEATKARIRQIAGEVGYQVNHVARSLAMRSTSTLGLIVPEVENPYFPKLIQLLVDQARSAGYSMLLNISGIDQQEEALCLQSMYERRTDGIILVTGIHGLVARDAVMRLHRTGVPLLLLGWVEEADELDLVMGDDAAGAYDLTRHLLALGHRRIVLVGPKESRGPYDRIRGFQRALCEAGLPLDESLYLGVYTEQDVVAALETLLRKPAPPTALFAYQDKLAAWMLRYCNDSGIAVPEQVAVVGFDNLDLAQYVSPHLTTVDYPVEAAAEKVIPLLLSRIQGDESVPSPCHVILTPHVVVRQSCGAVSFRSSAARPSSVRSSR